MRIIGGEFGGRKIVQPDVKGVRPTKDRIREAVFNMIADKVAGVEVLDVFAGSGAYGLEALSRGAERAVFIDKDSQCVGAIKENIEGLGVEDRVSIKKRDVFRSEDILKDYKDRFGVVFADPPFRKGMARNILIMANRYDILLPSGVLVLEHHREENVPDVEGSLYAVKRRLYNYISISLYLRK